MSEKIQDQTQPEESVRVYNRSTRQTFQHEVKVGDDIKKYAAPPSSFATVPRSVADRWMRLFPEVVIEAAVAQRELGGATAELNAARKQIADLEAQLVAAKDGGDLPAAQVRIAQLEQELARVTNPNTAEELVAAKVRVAQLEKELAKFDETNAGSDLSRAQARVKDLEAQLKAAQQI